MGCNRRKEPKKVCVACSAPRAVQRSIRCDPCGCVCSGVVGGEQALRTKKRKSVCLSALPFRWLPLSAPFSHRRRRAAPASSAQAVTPAPRPAPRNAHRLADPISCAAPRSTQVSLAGGDRAHQDALFFSSFFFLVAERWMRCSSEPAARCPHALRRPAECSPGSPTDISRGCTAACVGWAR